MKKKFLIIYLFAILLAVLIVGMYVFKNEYGYKFKLVKPRYETSKVYSKTVSNSNLDTIWCGTFQVAWNELMDYAGGTVEFEETESLLASELNQRNFTKEMLSENSYYVKQGKASGKLKNEIDKDLKEKFNIKDGAKILEGQELDNSNGILIYSMLKKNFTFLEKFDDLKPGIFTGKDGNSEKVKIFGIDEDSEAKLCDNVEVLYWDPKNVDNTGVISNECAVKLKTKENEEVILYRTDKEDNFENLYNELLNLSSSFEGNKKFSNYYDELKIPCIDIDVNISYDELCNKIIKNTNSEYISKAIQNIKFNLNSEGGLIFSEAAIITDSMSAPSTNARLFYFTKPFVIFVKEQDKEKPYFAMKINNSEYLQLESENK